LFFNLQKISWVAALDQASRWPAATTLSVTDVSASTSDT
jgi:hypothetical protein